MTYAFLVYLFTRLMTISVILEIIAAFSGIATVILFVFVTINKIDNSAESDEWLNFLQPIYSKVALVFFVSLAIVTIIPDKQTVKYMAGAYIAQKYIEDGEVVEALKGAPKDVLLIATDGLKLLRQDILKELNPRELDK